MAEKLAFEEALDYALRGAEKKFDDVVVHGSRSQARQIKFTNNELSTGRTWMDQSVSLFVAKERRVAVTTLKELERKGIDGTLEKMGKFIRKSQPNEEYRRIAKGPFVYKDVQNLFDPRVQKLTPEELVGFVETGINSALEKGATRASGVLQTSSTKEVLKTSEGAHAHQKGTSLTFSIRAFAEKDASGHKLSCARALQHFRPGDAGAKAGETAKQALRPQPGKPGKFDILFEPLAAAGFYEHVADAASIFAVEAGFSFLAGRMNKTVASDILTIFDDATLPGGMASTKFDAEGVPTSKTTLVRFGVLRNYLHNTSTAKRYGVHTTGNAGIIHPHPWNVVVDKGNLNVWEMLQELKNGLYVTNLWYTRFQNYLTGDFSTIPRDAVFVVENGEITGSIKDIRISDNLPNMLRNIEALSEAREQILGWEVETPVKCGHTLIRNVDVTKSTERSGEAKADAGALVRG